MASSTRKDPRDKSYVRQMFDEISGRYDFLNHSLSCFQDIIWRRACCKELCRMKPGKRLLDLCGGTGDFAVTYEKFNGIQDLAVLGDFSYGMLKGAKGKKTTAVPIQLDAMKMPFAENSFDVVLNGFGMRNVPDVGGALTESCRVLGEGGYLQILEFFSPRNTFNKIFYKVLAPLFIPVMGAFFSKRDAYEYLVNSVLNFLPVDDFVQLAESRGFELVHVKPCFFGVAYRVLLRKRGAVSAEAG
ncbi:MAG: ubiquinone/menaquinone biosynthesis methyltransferase [Fibrobacter sp.]|nr:ubiquinone/menaquinone biosynthesis methyltransferase [Fibrobacter sp.]